MCDRFFEQVAAITEGASKGASLFKSCCCCLLSLVLQSMYDRYYVSFKISDPGHVQSAVALMDHLPCLAASRNTTSPDASLPLIINVKIIDGTY